MDKEIFKRNMEMVDCASEGMIYNEVARKFNLSAVTTREIITKFTFIKNRCKDKNIKQVYELFDYNIKIINVLDKNGYNNANDIISLFKDNPEKAIRLKNMGLKLMEIGIDLINTNSKTKLDKKKLMSLLEKESKKIPNEKKREVREEVRKRRKDLYYNVII